jgi:hypothetical protein
MAIMFMHSNYCWVEAQWRPNDGDELIVSLNAIMTNLRSSQPKMNQHGMHSTLE